MADVAYLAFTAGYAPGSGPTCCAPTSPPRRSGWCGCCASLLPASFDGRVELDALLALMLLQHSRRDARVRDGRLVLLPDQDRSRVAPRRGRRGARPAAAAGRRPARAVPAPGADRRRARGRAHAGGHRLGPDRRCATRELEALTGSPVVRLNRAVAVAEADGPLAGLALLDGLALPGHRLPAARAELLARAGRLDEARTSYDEAIGRCTNLAERAHLIERRARL